VAFSSQRFDNRGYKRDLQALARELGVEHAVHFLGQRDDVAGLLAAADLLLLPSHDEPFGLVVAEALAVGTPVLATNRGGVGEYVEDGVSGHLLPPGQPAAWATAAGALLEDPDALQTMGVEGLIAASRFTDERYSAEMLSVYRQAVGTS